MGAFDHRPSQYAVRAGRLEGFHHRHERHDAFDLSSPHGRMLATFLSGIAGFERDLISERVKSGLAAAKARGKRLGRQIGERPKSDRLAPKVVALIAEGRSYRWIARDLGISKNTVAEIAKRHRAANDAAYPTSNPDVILCGSVSSSVPGIEDTFRFDQHELNFIFCIGLMFDAFGNHV